MTKTPVGAMLAGHLPKRGHRAWYLHRRLLLLWGAEALPLGDRLKATLDVMASAWEGSLALLGSFMD